MGEFELWISLVSVTGLFLGLYLTTYFELRRERASIAAVKTAAKQAADDSTIAKAHAEASKAAAAALGEQVEALEKNAKANVEQVEQLKRAASANEEQVQALKKIVEAATSYLEGAQKRETALLSLVSRTSPQSPANEERRLALEEQKLALQKQAQDLEGMKSLLGLLFAPKKSSRK